MSRICEQLAPDLFSPRVSAPAYPDGIPREICDLFERLALEVHANGFDRYSARAIAHRARWHEHIDKGNREFAFNNTWTPALARWFVARHPSMAKFFELRASPHAEDDER